MQTSKENTKIFSALFQVQAAITGVERNASNPFHNNRYATLDAVIKTAREPLHMAGIVFTQAPGRFANGCLEVTTRLTHADSGQWLSITMDVPLARVDAQSAGSAITYGCRYSLMAILGMPPVDDDAEASMGRPSSLNKKSAYRARKDGDWEPLLAEMLEHSTIDSLKAWASANSERIGVLPESWLTHFREKYEDHFLMLKARDQHE